MDSKVWQKAKDAARREDGTVDWAKAREVAGRDPEPLAKGGNSPDLSWCYQFQGTPLYERALEIEKRYYEECKKIGEEHEKARKRRDAAEAKMRKLLDQQEPYYNAYEKKHELREKIGVEKKELMLELIDLEQKRAKDNKGMYRSRAPGDLEKGSPAKPPKAHREAGATKPEHYADPEGFKYPIHDEAHTRAAISYFSKPKNAEKYEAGKRSMVWKRIKGAAKKFSIELSEGSGPPGFEVESDTGESKREK